MDRWTSQFPWDNYPWFTLGMTRAVLRSQLRWIEDDHLFYFPECSGDQPATKALQQLRVALEAVQGSQTMAAITIVDRLWGFYHSRGRYEISSRCIRISNIRYHFPQVHAVS